MAATFRCIVYLIISLKFSQSYRVLKSGETTPEGAYFKPFERSFVGINGDPSNLIRERINEGAFETATQELLFEGPSPR